MTNFSIQLIIASIGKNIFSFLKILSGEFIGICKERLTEGELYDSLVGIENNSLLGNDS